MQHNLVRVTAGHARMSLGPVVRYSVGEDRSGPIEGGGSDWAGASVEGCYAADIVAGGQVINERARTDQWEVDGT